MKLKVFLKNVLEKGNVGLGWFVFWRMALVIVPLNLIARMIAETTGVNSAAGLGALFVLPIGGNFYLVPIAIPVVLFLWDFLGKKAMEAKLGIKPAGFLGWALYWRFVLMQFAGILVLAVGFVPIVFLAQALGETAAIIIGAVFGILAFAGLIYWNLNVVGFVVKKVAATATPAARAEKDRLVREKGLVRDYRDLFDIPAHGMNWMVAGAYAAAGFVGFIIFPFVDALFGEDISFPPVNFILTMLPNLIIGGLALAWILHWIKIPWQAVGIFALVMVLNAIFIEGPVSRALDPGPGEEGFFNLPQILTRVLYAGFFIGGLLMGLRFRGPTFLGFALGIGAALLIYSLFINPIIWGLSLDIEMDFFWRPERLLHSTLITVIDATFSGAALWWACGWHLKQRGLGLSSDGSIVSGG